MTATTVIASKIQPVLHGSPSRSGSIIIDGSALAETLTSIAHKVNVIFIVDSSTLPTWRIPQTTTPAQRLAASFARFTRRVSLPRNGGQVGLCNVLFEACSAFTHVTACTLAGSSKMTRYIRGSSHFVTSMTAPIASGWSDSRVGLSPTGKRRLRTAHAKPGRTQKGKWRPGGRHFCLSGRKR